MKTKRRLRGSGASMSRRVAPDTAAPTRMSRRVAPDTLNIETVIKQKYIKRMLNKIKNYYKKVTMYNVYLMKTQPGSKWFFSKQPDLERATVTFESIKTALKKCDIDRQEFLPQEINAEQWMNEFYSDIAYAYLNSNSYTDYLKAVKPRQQEFFRLVETVYLPKHVTVNETEIKGDDFEFEEISASKNYFYASNGYYETVGRRIFKVWCVLEGSVFTTRCDLLFKTHCACGLINNPQPTDTSYYSRHKMFDNNGYRKLDADKAETLLHVMGTHPTASHTLTPDVVEEIARLTSK